MIRGITVTLFNKRQTGTDEAGAPVFEETPEEIENVLVGMPSADDVGVSLQMYGKRISYWLAIPKGDAHEWTDRRVSLPAPFSGLYRTFGFPVAGIEENIPLNWNKKVMVERYG